MLFLKWNGTHRVDPKIFYILCIFVFQGSPWWCCWSELVKEQQVSCFRLCRLYSHCLGSQERLDMMYITLNFKGIESIHSFHPYADIVVTRVWAGYDRLKESRAWLKVFTTVTGILWGGIGREEEWMHSGFPGGHLEFLQLSQIIIESIYLKSWYSGGFKMGSFVSLLQIVSKIW